MYKVYVLKRRKRGSEVVKNSKTDTPSYAAASAAFWEIRKDTRYKGKNFLLLMTKDKVKLNVHSFLAKAGDEPYIELDQTLNSGEKHVH